jgi:apolipoprotein N-acyltransferase
MPDWSTLTRWQRVGLAVLSGLILGFAFPPTGLAGGLLAFVGLVPLLVALESTTRLRQAFATSWLAMFVLGLVATYWVGGWKSGSEVDPFLMLGGVLLAIVHPFFLVVPWLLYDGVRRRISPRAALYSLPLLIAGFEYWHSFGDLSFPWLSLYNTQSYNLAYIQFIEWTGPFALSIAIALVNVEVFRLLNEPRRGRQLALRLSTISVLISVPYVYGFTALSGSEVSKASMRMTVVQPNIDPWAKWQQDEQRVLDTNFSASRAAIAKAGESTDLLIWPETAITFYITSDNREYEMQRLQQFIQSVHTPLLTGFPDREEYVAGRDSIPEDAHQSKVEGFYFRSWNAAMLTFPRAEGGFTIERYHKQKLVPLGEHVPFVDMFPVLGKIFQWGVGLGSWNVGTGYEPLRMPLRDGTDTLAITPLICYESIYPSFVRHFVRSGANVLAVITNDGWYGMSSGPYQHDQFAVLRAIENRRWVARSANTGISTFIDDRGRFHGSLPLFEAGSVTAAVPLIDRLTFYTRFGDFVAIPSLAYTAILLVYLIVLRFRRRRRERRDGMMAVPAPRRTSADVAA